MEEKIKKLKQQAYMIRKQTLQVSNETMIHVGGDLSMTDIMTALYLYKMNISTDDPKWSGRDRFILSKGHGAACLYLVMAAAGYWTFDDVYNDYSKLGSRFGLHPCRKQNPQLELSSGSLGHGISIGAGMARALRISGSSSRVYTLLGDGEINEGNVWEGAMTAASMELGNLVAIVDRNRIGFNNPTEDRVKGLCLEPLADKWRAFGWNVIVVDGHDMRKIVEALDSIPDSDSKVPTVIICETVKGKGVTFMENDPKWHSGLLSDEQLEQALKELAENYSEEAANEHV